MQKQTVCGGSAPKMVKKQMQCTKCAEVGGWAGLLLSATPKVKGCLVSSGVGFGILLEYRRCLGSQRVLNERRRNSRRNGEGVAALQVRTHTQ